MPTGYSILYNGKLGKIPPWSKDMIKSTQCVLLINYLNFDRLLILLDMIFTFIIPLGSLLYVKGSKVTPGLQIND